MDVPSLNVNLISTFVDISNSRLLYFYLRAVSHSVSRDGHCKVEKFDNNEIHRDRQSWANLFHGK